MSEDIHYDTLYRATNQTNTLRKHAYSNILEILPLKNENFQQGGSNEYQQSMFLSRNKKINIYPCKPQFYYINVGFKGVNRHVFVMILSALISFRDIRRTQYQG